MSNGNKGSTNNGASRRTDDAGMILNFVTMIVVVSWIGALLWGSAVPVLAGLVVLGVYGGVQCTQPPQSAN